MAAVKCLRTAFDACRPRPTLAARSATRSILQCRAYADITGEKAASQNKESTHTKPSGNNSQTETPLSKQIATSTAPDAATNTHATTETSTQEVSEPRPIPANVLAAYRVPLKHEAPYGVPVASLQLRSYSVRSLEFFADFALRAAYYLNLPASGPVPLPKRRERWTMPKSNFVHKKTQENFERITHKRLITIMDGEKSAVEVWLAVLRKWQFYGVGMKANVWEWSGIDVASKMDAQAKDMEAEISAKLAQFGWNKQAAETNSVGNLLRKQGVKAAGVPMTEIREASRHQTSEV